MYTAPLLFSAVSAYLPSFDLRRRLFKRHGLAVAERASAAAANKRLKRSLLLRGGQQL